MEEKIKIYQDPLGLPIFSYKLLRNFKVVEELTEKQVIIKHRDKLVIKRKTGTFGFQREFVMHPGSW